MTNIAIASGSKISADAGAAIAAQGGNAVDAAIAGTLVSMCTDLGVMAPGAGGFITIWPANEAPIVLMPMQKCLVRKSLLEDYHLRNGGKESKKLILIMVVL